MTGFTSQCLYLSLYLEPASSRNVPILLKINQLFLGFVSPVQQPCTPHTQQIVYLASGVAIYARLRP